MKADAFQSKEEIDAQALLPLYLANALGSSSRVSESRTTKEMGEKVRCPLCIKQQDLQPNKIGLLTTSRSIQS